MANLAETQPLKKFLRVTQSPRVSITSRVASGVDGVLKKTGFEGMPEKPMPAAPQSRELPRAVGFGKYPRFGEGRRIARAMQEMSGETSFDAGQWKVEAVRIDRKGRERATHLLRWPFGWEAPVRRAHKKDVRRAARALKHDIHVDAKGTLKGENPIRQALAREAEEAKVLQKVDKEAVVSGLFGLRAKLLAKIAEGNPERVANGKFSRFLKLGQSRAETYGQLHTMMLQVADEQLDPTDKIHGPFEAGVKALQKFQRGIGGAVLTSIVGDISLFNKLTGWMINGNKIASRDARSELTIQGIARVIRRVGFIDRYGKFYNQRAKKKGFGGWVNRFILYPPDSLVEQATDRRMQQGNIAKLGKTEAILRATNLTAPLERAHQRVVSEEFVRAYNAPAPQLEVLMHTGFSSVGKASERVAGGAKNGAAKAGEIARKVTSRVERIVPKALRRRKAQPAGAAVDPRKTLNDAIAAYGGRPLSTREQVEAILTHGQAVLAEPLTGRERARWQRAIEYSARFYLLNEVASTLSQPVAA